MLDANAKPATTSSPGPVFSCSSCKLCKGFAHDLRGAERIASTMLEVNRQLNAGFRRFQNSHALLAAQFLP